MDVPAELQCIRIAVDDFAAVPTLKDLSPSIVPPVHVRGIRCVEPLDGSGNRVRLSGFNHQMDVVRHERIRMETTFVSGQCFFHQAKISPIVCVNSEDSFPIVSACHDVIPSTRKPNARRPRHESSRGEGRGRRHLYQRSGCAMEQTDVLTGEERYSRGTNVNSQAQTPNAGGEPSSPPGARPP